MDEEQADKATVIRDISNGRYSNPVRVVAFNTAEGWSRDVRGFAVAGGLGFEPRLTESESAVLPLDDPPL